MSIADEIEKLNKLKEQGALTEEEYENAKKSLLAQQESPGEKLGKEVGRVSTDVNMWSMFIHLSQFAGFIIPLAGLVVPIILWQMKKNESEIIDRHGKIVVNWIITEFIFGVVFGILCFVIVGIPLLIALVAVGIIFPIIGGIKANNGEIWPYPLSIKFFQI